MVITSRKNDAVRRFRELSHEKKLRDEQGVFLIEGDHLCSEAAKLGLELVFALVTEKASEKYPQTVALLREKCGVTVISDDLAEYISDTRSPQGLFAEVRRKPQTKPVGTRLLMMDGVQDPGNVGTMIRTAEALGIDGVVLSENCADVYSPKTLRSAMGSVFRMPCITGSLTEIITGLKAEGFAVYGAMLDETASALGRMEFPEKCAVVIGSEGRGISDGVKAVCTGGLYIPIIGAESLNAAAAAAVICWELKRDK